MALDCRLCDATRDGDQTEVFGDRLVAFLQKPKEQGALKGSGIIIPRRHAETVFDLSDDEIAATFGLLAEVKAWMDTEYRPDGYIIGWNCYEVGGQHDMHAHLHVIPRFRQEPFAGRGIRYWLKRDENRW